MIAHKMYIYIFDTDSKLPAKYFATEFTTFKA